MIIVRIISEQQLSDQARPLNPVFLDTRSFNTVPQIGEEVSVGEGNERRTGKVIRTYQTNMSGESLFAVEDPWIVLRLD